MDSEIKTRAKKKNSKEIKIRPVVIGLGECGRPLFDILAEKYEDIQGLDKNQDVQIKLPIDVCNICIPGNLPDFVDIVCDYVEKFKPGLIIIHSTVAVGTTKKIAEKTGIGCVHSPIKGKHKNMLADLRKYTKYIGGTDIEASEKAYKFLKGAGFKTSVEISSEMTEFMKLMETSYFGALIVIAQEFNRYCEKLGLNYENAMEFIKEVDYLPRYIFQPGAALGHCVPSNYELLERVKKSYLIDFFNKSNNKKIKELKIDIEKEKNTKTRTVLKPRKFGQSEK